MNIQYGETINIDIFSCGNQDLLQSIDYKRCLIVTVLTGQDMFCTIPHEISYLLLLFVSHFKNRSIHVYMCAWYHNYIKIFIMFLEK